MEWEGGSGYAEEGEKDKGHVEAQDMEEEADPTAVKDEQGEEEMENAAMADGTGIAWSTKSWVEEPAASEIAVVVVDSEDPPWTAEEEEAAVGYSREDVGSPCIIL